MATALQARRRRYELEINARRRVPLGRQMLRALLFINYNDGCGGQELAEETGMDPGVAYVMVARLASIGLITRQLVRDKESRTGRRSEYYPTAMGKRLSYAWDAFLKTLGPALARKLRLEE